MQTIIHTDYLSLKVCCVNSFFTLFFFFFLQSFISTQLMLQTSGDRDAKNLRAKPEGLSSLSIFKFITFISCQFSWNFGWNKVCNQHTFRCNLDTKYFDEWETRKIRSWCDLRDHVRRKVKKNWFKNKSIIYKQTTFHPYKFAVF